LWADEMWFWYSQYDLPVAVTLLLRLLAK
jgi:hypothetical protein